MRLSRLSVKNFECVGNTGIDIKLDDIVILIGTNNSGKSTILNAYEVFCSSGTALALNRFHEENPANAVEIIGTFTDISDIDKEKIGQGWIHADDTCGDCIKVRWLWKSPGEKGKKYSWQQTKGDWHEGGMGGIDSLLASRLPVPIRISPRDNPEETEAKLTEILTSEVKNRLKADSSIAKKLLENIEDLSNKFRTEMNDELDKTCSLIQEKLVAIFPNHEVHLVAAAGKFEPEKSIATGTHVRIGKSNSSTIPLSMQGTGMQRAFLWSALAALAEIGKLKMGKREIPADQQKILLIDEPEAFLHPPLIRAARETMYAIAELSDWQVMATTHSPIFIDVSKPHTTIIRISRAGEGSPKLFSTDSVGFNETERKQLHMIRSCHPTVNEFFFADHVFLVEGETEQIVLKFLLERANSEISHSRHVVNCLGKGNIPLYARILNQFKVPYTILHDSDIPRYKARNGDWKTNPMWAINERIAEVSNSEKNSDCSRIVHIPDFEQHYFGMSRSKYKPDHILDQILAEDFETNPDLEGLRSLSGLINKNEHSHKYDGFPGMQTLVQTWLGNNPNADRAAWNVE